MMAFWWIAACVYALLTLGNLIAGESSLAINDFLITTLIVNIIIREKTIKKLGG